MADAPAEKRQKVEEAKEDADMDEGAEKPTEEKAAEEKPKVPEPPKELETDAAPISGAKIKETVVFHTHDTTLNVLASTAGANLFMSMNEGGIRTSSLVPGQIFASARAGICSKSGFWST